MKKNARKYPRNGREYWSVTTVLDAINKPALVEWASRSARDATRQVAVEAYRLAHPVPAGPGRQQCLGLDPSSFVALVEKLQGRRPAHLAASEQATSIGSLVHARIEAELRWELGQSVPLPEVPRETVVDGRAVAHPAWSAYRAYRAWRAAHDVRVVSVEQKVYSDRYEYAGTADLVAYVDGVLTVGDFKTSKAVYGEYRLQVAAYRQAVLEMEPDVQPPVGGLVLRFPKTEGDDFEAHAVPWEEQDELLSVFLSAKRVWEWMLADEARAKRNA